VRLALLLADAGAAALLLWLLPQAGWPRRRALAYLLHPLVVVEIAGSVHMEGVVVCFLLLVGALLARRRLALAAGALAVATKLLPLLAVPLLARHLGWARLRRFGLVLAGSLLLLFLPFLSGHLLGNIGRSLNLYFQRFEFNASVFYVLRALGNRLVGYDLVGSLGPLLGVGAAGLTLWRAGRPALASLPHWLLLTLSGYLVLATTVHP